MSERLGEVSVTCGACGASVTIPVYRDVHGAKYSTCPECETNVRVIAPSLDKDD